MVSTAVIDDFLAQQHLAFVGVSHEPKEFSATVYRELKAHGYELHPVNPHADAVDGDPCVSSVADLPDGIDGAIVMVPAAASASVVQECIDRGIPRVWLHQGAGPSSVTDEAVALFRRVRDKLGITILLIEHSMRVVMDISEHITVMDYGLKIAEGLPQEISTNPKVVEAYLGRGAADLLDEIEASAAQSPTPPAEKPADQEKPA